MKKYLLFSISILGVLVLASGCATSKKTPQETKRLAILPLNVNAYEWPDGIQPLRKKEWELVIIKNIMTVFDEKFTAKGVQYKTITEASFSEDQKQNLHETRAQWWGLWVNNFQQSQIPSHLRNIADYNLGAEVALLDPESDLLLLVSAGQTTSTSDRKSRRATANSIKFLGELTVAILSLGKGAGGYVSYEQGGSSGISLVLVDAKTGQVVWYESSSREEVDLRDLEETKSQLFHIFRTFPWDKYQFR